MIDDLRAEMATTGRVEPKYHALSRPPEAEGEATSRAIDLARIAETQLYVVHVTCSQALEAIARAKSKNQPVFGETCPQYLLLEDSVYEKPDFEGAAYVIAPPLRPVGHQEALWKGIESDQLDVVGTDHCPFNMGQKEAGREDFRIIPGGAAGVEHRLSLLYTYGVLQNRIDLHHFVDLVSTRPARIFGLYPRKGSIRVGADADLVLWDPSAENRISVRTHHQRCDRNIYEGFKTRGAPSVVIAAGKIVFASGDLRVEPGAGRFLERTVQSPSV
jgi:dihydropyrimidinase